MALVPASRLGPYEIVAPLGAGGMGEVYRARDTRLRREIAIKVLPDDVRSSADRLLRFEREAMAVAALNHPNIVTIHSIEHEDGIHFLTMELVEGKSLAELVTPGGLSVDQVLHLAIPLAGALVAAHEKGVGRRVPDRRGVWRSWGCRGRLCVARARLRAARPRPLRDQDRRIPGFPSQ